MSEARNTVVFATSSAVPPRFKGMLSLHPATTFGSNASVISVSMNPGAIALLRIFLEPNSKATDFVNPMIPAFEAA